MSLRLPCLFNHIDHDQILLSKTQKAYLHSDTVKDKHCYGVFYFTHKLETWKAKSNDYLYLKYQHDRTIWTTKITLFFSLTHRLIKQCA